MQHIRWVGQVKKNCGGRHLRPDPRSAATFLADWQCSASWMCAQAMVRLARDGTCGLYLCIKSD